MPKARLVFDGDNIYTEKDARVYKLKTSVSSKIDTIPWVVDSLDSTSSTDALSANMGRQLQDQINSLSWTWKFLSTWDCTTWLPGTNPQEDPYTYKVWDYYVVSATGSTNYKPHWGTYTQWVPSTTVELENVWTNDKYYFDGADWVRIPDTAIQTSIDSALSTTSTNAVENRAITNAINTKQNIISDLNDIRSWAAAGSTALQRLANISELTNNLGYQTAWDVASAIAWKANISDVTALAWRVTTAEWKISALETSSADYASRISNLETSSWWASQDIAALQSDVSDLQNGLTSAQWDITSIEWDISDLQDAIAWITIPSVTITNNSNIISAAVSWQDWHTITISDTANAVTKQYVDDSIDWVTHSGSTAPSNPTAWQLWYDTTNNVLKVYNWTTWVEVGGWITNDTTWTTSTISQEWVGTKAEFEALSSYWNKIYNIIE